MDKCNLFKLALSGLAAGFCLVGCSKKEPPAENPPQTEEGEADSSGGPTCASCTVPSDCSDVSKLNDSPSSESLRLKRSHASKDPQPEEAECNKIY